MKKRLVIILAMVISVGLVFTFFHHLSVVSDVSDNDDKDPDDTAVSQLTPASQQDIQSEPSSQSALGGYNVLIADRGNNRLIEVTPNKKIVWQYDFNVPGPGLGADDAFFTDNGKTIIVNLELYHLIEQIDYQTKRVIWQYGVPGKPGSSVGYLNRPDDAYKLSSGNVITADIKNCRVIEISPDKRIVRQYGVSGVCSNEDGYLNKPNGDTPLSNGHILISNIRNNSVIELDQDWRKVLTLKVPLKYPSDPQSTKAGNILIADYSDPGKIIEISRNGSIVWEYFIKDGLGKLNSPSLAMELPNGNILANDDLNHRVIVIDKNTKRIVWQYGVMGKPGNKPGQLNIPDGVDIIKRDSGSAAINSNIYSVGQVIHHPQDFLGQTVKMKGYPLKNEGSYIIFSDEKSGALTANDLPVIGQNVAQAVLTNKYILTGRLVRGGLESVNKNPYHFELSAPLEVESSQ